MRRLLFAMILALILCSTAAADLYVNIGTSGGAWPQAPYIITPTSGAPDWIPASFNTFCVERYVTFTPGNYRATVDNDILYAYAGTTTPLLLQDDVKRIYAAYLNNELGAFTPTQIQESVWGAQGYGTYTVLGGINTIINNDADAIVGWNDVRVLNLWGANGQDIQSQLVKTPLPGAALLGALGIGFASLRLRRKKHAA